MQENIKHKTAQTAALPSAQDFKIIVITRPDFFEGEAQQINQLFSAGLRLLHIRKPQANKEQVESLINQISQQYWPRLVLHTHFELVEQKGLRGIHLGLNRQGHSQHTSYSCHSLSEVIAQKPHRDYLFLSPIFDSISKEGYRKAFTQQALLEAKTKGIIDSKVIALSGISTANLCQVKELGFGGVALLGAIWQNPSPVAALTEFIRLSNP